MVETSVLSAARAAFSASYGEARKRFRALAPSARSYPSPATGPGGEALPTDVAWFGPQNAPNVVVSIAGTHGVEGYCGSACQIDWMVRGAYRELGPGTAALLIHALNPYGFAWDRRVTEEGCDLNRNFVDFTKPLPANPGYKELAQHLVPASLDGPEFVAAEQAIALYRERRGEIAFQTARKSGQYTHPAGMFFGGTAPTSARRALESIAADFRLAQRQQVIIIDYHTGLGPFGYGELQTEPASGMDGYRRAVSIFGGSVTSPDLGTSSSIALHGTLDEYWEQLLGDRHTYVCLEYGTYDPERGRRVLRQDHWLAAYHPEVMDEPLGRSLRAETRSHYSPDQDDWKEMIVSRSRDVTCQAEEWLGAARDNIRSPAVLPKSSSA
jgi:hypothetical protein